VAEVDFENNCKKDILEGNITGQIDIEGAKNLKDFKIKLKLSELNLSDLDSDK
jgi:hypothetical protein